MANLDWRAFVFAQQRWLAAETGVVPPIWEAVPDRPVPAAATVASTCFKFLALAALAAASRER